MKGQIPINRICQRKPCPPAEVLRWTGRQDEKEIKYLFVKAGKEIIKLKVSEIQYIEGMREYVRINMEKRKVLTLQSMSKFIDMINSEYIF